ncbi:MAG: hypothetical protein AMXMBFR53_30210 [Gemmatimonadota bacterium]
MDKRYHVMGQVIRTVYGHGDTPLDAIKDFHAQGGGHPEWAWEGDNEDDGEGVQGLCENCGLPVLDREDSNHDDDGNVWHVPNCTQEPTDG